MFALLVASLVSVAAGSPADDHLSGNVTALLDESADFVAQNATTANGWESEAAFTATGSFDASQTSLGSYFDATTLHWNSHRPCATQDPACIAKARQSLAHMVREVGAKIVGTVELHHAAKALPGWQSTGEQWDWATVMVAEGWQISKSGGWAMGGDKAKGFAVAVVEPPERVQSCPSLCVFMGHIPHPGQKLDGHYEIDRVCGALKHGCMIAMADWNRGDISDVWKTLMHDAPTLVEPHDKTCCYNDGFHNRFDHTSTNIAGSYSAGNTVFDPQLTQFPSWCEHKPTSVHLRLPSGSQMDSLAKRSAPLSDDIYV